MPRKNKAFKKHELVFVNTSDYHHWNSKVVGEIIQIDDPYNDQTTAYFICQFLPGHPYNVKNISSTESFSYHGKYNVQSIPQKFLEKFGENKPKLKVKTIKQKLKNIMDVDF